ncbi:MAG: nucleotide exchange factor GrpE [Dehalococcoidia bacterium]|nr:nucleotide exchange factor GrpE [Dehalococcoidia bacterium]
MNESESVQPTDAVLEPDDAGDAASIEELTAELERTRAAYQRAMADYQNLQRRSREDRAEQTRLTMKTLVLNYLPVLDDLNRALDSVTQHPELADHAFVDGVRMVQRKFTSVLEGAGVQAIEAGTGVAFDPQHHEAVAYTPGPLNQVVAVIQAGYVLDSTIIRPAMVVVGNGEGQAGAEAGT